MDGLSAIIAGAQRGDPAAMEALVDRYSARLFGLFFRMCGARDEAEDLMQEVFLRIVRTIGQYRDDGRFEPWLFRIAANLARDRIRRVRRSPIRVAVEAEGPDEEPIPEAAPDGERPDRRLETAEEVDRLNAALALLPDGEREVIMLRHFSQLSFKEIAEILGTPLGTALARSHRGLARLRSLMENDESMDAGQGGDPGETSNVGRTVKRV